MNIKQLHADKKESFRLEVELENGLTVGLSDYLRALHARLERLEALAQPSPAAASVEPVQDHDISDRG